MELWQLYLMVALPQLGKIFLVISLGFAGWAIAKICVVIEHNSDVRKHARWPADVPDVGPKRTVNLWPQLSAAGFSLLLFFGTPSSAGLYTIVGGYYATNLDGAKDLPPNIVKAANKFLEQYSQDKGND